MGDALCFALGALVSFGLFAVLWLRIDQVEKQVTRPTKGKDHD